MTQFKALFFTIIIESLSLLAFGRLFKSKISLLCIFAMNFISHPMAWTLSVYLNRGAFGIDLNPLWIFFMLEFGVIFFEKLFLGSLVLSIVLNTISAFLGLFILEGFLT